MHPFLPLLRCHLLLAGACGAAAHTGGASTLRGSKRASACVLVGHALPTPLTLLSDSHNVYISYMRH